VAGPGIRTLQQTRWTSQDRGDTQPFASTELTAAKEGGVNKLRGGDSNQIWIPL